MVSVAQCAMFALACLEILVDYQLRCRGREFDVGRFAQPGQGCLDERRGTVVELGWMVGGTSRILLGLAALGPIGPHDLPADSRRVQSRGTRRPRLA